MSTATLAAGLAEAFQFDWRSEARPDQLAPPGDWSTWVILAGRGWGKTRTGAEWARDAVCGSTPLGRGRYRQIALVAETAADGRDVLVGEGKAPGEGSGILQVHPKDFRPIYEPSKRRLTWPNGAIATLYNGTEPDQLRGPQHDGAWCDELAKWKYAREAWDMLQFGLRLGTHPRCVVTTTPKPIQLLKEIIADPETVVTRGRTEDNLANLSPRFISTVVRKYAGTRLGRQELDAEILEDVPGALWKRADIDKPRIKAIDLPTLRRVVVSIDPAVTSGENADETGIIVAGVGDDGHAYVIDDRSGRYSPDGWAREAIAAYRTHRADRIIAEVNNGGDLVESTVRTVDPQVPFKAVHASRGKAVRAEPIAALYEQGRVHHAGALPILEDQMCAFTADFDRARFGYSPDRVDALVWALSELMVQITPGWGILEYYRLEAEKVARPTDPNGANVRLRAPDGVSNVYGLDGRSYIVTAEGTVTVSSEDETPLLASGFIRIDEGIANV